MLDINEIGDVHNRIDQLVGHFCKGNKAAFGRGADIQSGVLAGLIGGRKNKPSFDVLQKLLTAYPTVEPHWLLFGRGPMIQGEANQPVVSSVTVEYAEEQFSRYIQEFIESGKLQNQIIAERARIESPEYQIQLMKMYAVLDTSSSHHKRQLLSDRLAISEEDAEQLVLSGRIPAMKISDSAGYRVSEEWVREYLSGTVEASRSMHEHHLENKDSFLEKLLVPDGHHYTDAEREKLLKRAKPAKE